MTILKTETMWKEIDDNCAESLNGGAVRWQNFNIGSVGALQVNGGNGVQNNYYIFSVNLGGRRK